MLDDREGMAADEMWEVGAEAEVPIVVRLVPRSVGDLEVVVQTVESRLATADRFGVRHRCVLEPWFAPVAAAAPSEERDALGTFVSAALSALGRFELPLSYVVPRGADGGDGDGSDGGDGLVAVVVERRLEFARSHDPSIIRRAQQRILG